MRIIKFFLLSLVFGTFSNIIGGIIGYIDIIKFKRSVNSTISFTGGITIAIICFELLKEAFDMGNKYLVVIFTLVGIILVVIMDFIINRVKYIKNNKTSFLITSAISAHNITEGLAIGAAFAFSNSLGTSLMFAIMVHNIPEGMIIGLIDKRENKKIKSTINNCIIIGVFLGVGASLGAYVGNIASKYIMECLSISAGAMLYILACELMPEMYESKNNRIGIIFMMGFILGIILCFI